MLLAAQSCALLMIDLQERLLPALDDHPNLLSRCRLVLQAALRLDVPVLLTEQYPQGLGPTVATIASPVTPLNMVSKTAFSAMRDPQAAEQIGLLGRATLVVVGAETHVCVLQTVMDLLEQGRRVAVVADAVGSRRPSDKQAGLVRMQMAGAEIVTTEMVVFEWLERAATPAFKALSPLIR